MPPLIKDIVCSARKTFALVCGDQFEESALILKSLLSQLQASDIAVTEADMQFQRRFLSPKSPVKFMTIHEEAAFTVTAFIVSPNQRVPLHDHPDMHGFLKCISGQIRVTSYSRLPADRQYNPPVSISTRVASNDRQRLISCVKVVAEAAAEEGSVLCLTPDTGNIHEVTSENGASAFVDVLGPPYCDESDCHYYEVIGSAVDRNLKREITWLLPVHPPANYFTEVIQYSGPNVA